MRMVLNHLQIRIKFRTQPGSYFLPLLQHLGVGFFAFTYCVLDTCKHVGCDQPYLIYQVFLLLEMVLQRNYWLPLFFWVKFQAIIIYFLRIIHRAFKIIIHFPCEFFCKIVIYCVFHSTANLFAYFFLTSLQQTAIPFAYILFHLCLNCLSHACKIL